MIGFYVQVHELAPIFGAVGVTIHALVDDETGELQRLLLMSYKIYKERNRKLAERQRADFEELVRIYHDNLKRFPDLAVGHG